MANPSPPRLVSLDALRGFDMLWIIGGAALFPALYQLTAWPIWQSLNQQMSHSTWHGFTAYDLIFPLFIFLSGVALGLTGKSLANHPLASRKSVYLQASRRLLLMCLLGVLYNHGWGQGIPGNWHDIRFASVLSRIGIAWFVTALIVWHCNLKWQAISLFAILFGYAVLQLWFPVPGFGAGQLTPEGSINAWVDQQWLPGITYQHRPYDPEGLLSHIPAIANALAGALLGKQLKSLPAKTFLLRLVIVGAASLTLGWVWNIWYPVNKELWTSSFALVTIGWSCWLLALFFLMFDVLPGQKFAYGFAIIGANSIAIYMASSWLDWSFMANSLTGGLAQASGDFGPLIQAVSVLALQLYLLHFCYQRRIFIKI